MGLGLNTLTPDSGCDSSMVFRPSLAPFGPNPMRQRGPRGHDIWPQSQVGQVPQSVPPCPIMACNSKKARLPKTSNWPPQAQEVASCSHQRPVGINPGQRPTRP
ncbi:hypothetical protein O181_068028 [Austropuccinia psidii MF-1]|uniref:Uncharacterized protein n=1 Tax=Austropuccinia psidii MF-1 TaxID=1389203 RepID=A0A9Q3EZR8_9BASI|nr:hypothetical protein [Austropuccinia psidii MF-1]